MKPTLLHRRTSRQSAFTMVEIAISLAIIGFAMVAIIGILPAGLTVQKENREETIINQDANYLMEAIRGGSRGLSDLTNYVDRIFVTNTVNNNGTVWTTNDFGLYPAAVIGLLSMPKYVPENPFVVNAITANIRAISGAAVDKPPQKNDSVRDLAFSYRLISEVVPYGGFDTNITNWTSSGNLSPQYTNWLIARTMQTNLYEVRLRFQWPLLPNGNTGPGRQTVRALVSGNLIRTNPIPVLSNYFFAPRSYASPL